MFINTIILLCTLYISSYSDVLITDSATPNVYQIPNVKMSGGENLLVSFEDVKSLKNDKNVLLIDVREPSELQETGVIPGSINIPCK